MQSILIVDDLESIHEMLDSVIQPIGYHTAFATDGQAALEKLRRDRHDIVLTDINMKPMDGLDLLAQIKEIDPKAIVIMMSGYANVENATRSLKLGAFDYLTKPFKVDQLMAAIKRASAERKRRLEDSASDGTDLASILAGDSAAVRKLRDNIARHAKTNTPLLLVGDSGTQKSSIANIIHQKSENANGAFVSLDAKALDRDAFESSLFDSEGGRSEKVAGASGGTLLIANVDQVDRDLQPSLGNLIRDLKSETRVICTSSRDLERLVETGEFEDALFFRIANGMIEVPNLNDRAEDIPSIAVAYFSKKGFSNLGIGDRASALMQAYRWPGNYKELKEVLETLAANAEGDAIHHDMLPERMRDVSSWPTLDEYLEQQRQRYRAQVLNACQGDVAKAAEILGCEPADLA